MRAEQEAVAGGGIGERHGRCEERPHPARGEEPRCLRRRGGAGGGEAKLVIVFYCMYGHVEGLAKQMKKGIDGIDGVEGVLFRAAETLPPEILEQKSRRTRTRISPSYQWRSWWRRTGYFLGSRRGMGAWLRR